MLADTANVVNLKSYYMKNNNVVCNDFEIITKDMHEIIDDIDFNSEDDKLICESIISNLEKTAVESIKDNKTISIPGIGCLRKNHVVETIKKSKPVLNLLRHNMSKTQYQEHIRSIAYDAKQEQKNADNYKLAIKRIRYNNKEKYKRFYININKSYAEMYIFSIYCLREIPFNSEVEDMFQKLNT